MILILRLTGAKSCYILDLYGYSMRSFVLFMMNEKRKLQQQEDISKYHRSSYHFITSITFPGGSQTFAPRIRLRRALPLTKTVCAQNSLKIKIEQYTRLLRDVPKIRAPINITETSPY